MTLSQSGYLATGRSQLTDLSAKYSIGLIFILIEAQKQLQEFNS